MTLLGDYSCDLEEFSSLDSTFKRFYKKSFRNLSMHKRLEQVCECLIQLLQAAPTETFLLKAVVSYLDRVNRAQLLDEPLTLSLFEFWLNHFSSLTKEENYLIRTKIVGKHLPRDDYGTLFPIGMNKVHPGSHFVTAHLSPDTDTTIASFWGWVDAFGARVAEAQHIWSLPGGAPASQATHLLHSLFGKALFAWVPRVSGSLTLSAMDLVTQENITKAHGETLSTELDHGIDRHAILYIDRQGHYLGDWRGTNFEPVRHITLQFSACLRWFENDLQVRLLALFAKETVQRRQLRLCFRRIFDTLLKDCEPAQNLTVSQRHLLQLFCQNVLALPKGLNSTFGALLKSFKDDLPQISRLITTLYRLESSSLFDVKGTLRENRPALFRELHRLIQQLDLAMHAIRNFIDRLDLVMKIKHDVLGYRPNYSTMHSDVEELHFKMQTRDYLTVVIQEGRDQLYPIGIIPARRLRQQVLGTVSQRDFCNLQEMRMASYLKVISVIDHHKATLSTETAPQALIGDAQSSNVLVAEQAIAINDRYSTAAMPHYVIEEQIHALSRIMPSRAVTRILERLLRRRMAAESRSDYFIDKQREYAEYLSFLYGILDDTDLLTKVTKRDVVCVASLLNRMKTLVLGREVEIIHFDGMTEGPSFAEEAAKRLLQNEDLYSIYGKIYAHREGEVAHSLRTAAQGKPTTLFSDTKEQNGCCRVGQIKMFASNTPIYQRVASKLRILWLKESMKSREAHPEWDLHLQMISTIASAEEVYHNRRLPYSHEDELWIFVAPTQTGMDHLGSFLSGFQSAPEVIFNDLSVEFLGPNSQKLSELFSRNFTGAIRRIAKGSDTGPPLAIVRYRAGTINSRKAMITPYLPHLVS